jgi:VIT1/CCC1 family predicted Fe2+/Mn2+ transporter
VPLVPFLLPLPAAHRLVWSATMTMAALFGVGAARAAVTVDRWWSTGLETLLLGAVVAVAAFGAGWLIASVS